jgi:asparagine synthase (glutamine-hydrolysing)
MLPDALRMLDSHEVVKEYVGDLTGRVVEPEVTSKIPYMEMKLRLPEHLLMRVDKMTMAHSIEARVPFLDHDVVDFAMRLPPSYKLADGLGKRMLKKIAEPYVDHDLLYRRKQGFGAPMDKWFQEPTFGKRCLSALENSAIYRDGFVDREYVMGLLRGQVEGRINYGFHLWTVMNAVFWHERWIERRLAA